MTSTQALKLKGNNLQTCFSTRRQQRMCRAASYASLAQEHCQAWYDAVQHILCGLQSTIRLLSPPLPNFGDLCEQARDVTLTSA